MHARATTLTIKPDQIDTAIRFFDDSKSEILALKGIREAYVLVNRETSDAMTVTVWDSEDDMQAAMPFVKEFFSSMGDILDGQPTPRMYEVAFHESGVPA